MAGGGAGVAREHVWQRVRVDGMALSMHRLARYSGMGSKPTRWDGNEGNDACDARPKTKQEPSHGNGKGDEDTNQGEGRNTSTTSDHASVRRRTSDRGLVEKGMKHTKKKEEPRGERNKRRMDDVEKETKPSARLPAVEDDVGNPAPAKAKPQDGKDARAEACHALHPFTSFRMVRHNERRKPSEEGHAGKPNHSREDTKPPNASTDSQGTEEEKEQEEMEEEDEEEDLFGTMDVWRWRFYRKWRNETGRNTVPPTQEEEEEGDDLEGIEFLRACTEDAANNFVSMSLESQSRNEGSETICECCGGSGDDVQTNGYPSSAAMMRRASLGQLLLEDPVVGALSAQEESPPETEPQWLKMDAARQKFASKLRTAKQLIQHQAEFETKAAEKWATAKGKQMSMLDTLLPVAISRSTSSAYVLMQAFDATGKRTYIIRSKPCENGLLSSSLTDIFSAVVTEARAEIKKKGGQAHIIGGGVVTWKMDTGRMLVVKIPMKTWKLDFIEGLELRSDKQGWELCEFARFSVILLKQNLPYDVTVRWEEEQSRQQLFF